MAYDTARTLILKNLEVVCQWPESVMRIARHFIFGLPTRVTLDTSMTYEQLVEVREANTVTADWDAFYFQVREWHEANPDTPNIELGILLVTQFVVINKWYVVPADSKYYEDFTSTWMDHILGTDIRAMTP